MSAAATFVLGLAALGVACAAAPGERAADPPRVEIVVADDGAQIRLVALYHGPAAEGLRYRFDVTRVGASGRSTSGQSGNVHATGTPPDTLSTTAVTAEGRVEAHLVLTDPSGAEVARDAFVRER